MRMMAVVVIMQTTLRALTACRGWTRMGRAQISVYPLVVGYGQAPGEHFVPEIFELLDDGGRGMFGCCLIGGYVPPLLLYFINH